MRRFKIYILTDPLSNEVRYVGQTVCTIHRRFKMHLREKYHCKKRHWIKSLYPLEPEIIEIDSTIDSNHCNELEVFWIGYFKMLGANLTNMTNGGHGTRLIKMSETTKQKISESKKNLSTEARKNISESAKKRGMPAGFHTMGVQARLRDKERIGAIIRQSNKTRIISEETRNKYRVRPQCIHKSKATRLKISNTLKAKNNGKNPS